MKTRLEQDSLGTLEINDENYYGIYTQRALSNFSLNEKTVNPRLIQSMILVKKACALTHKKLKTYDLDKNEAIIQACDLLLGGKYRDQFPTHPLQGGAGTTTNMNVNEVIANVALELLGKNKGEYDVIHPINHVNAYQSTNDVYPTAMRIASIVLLRELADEYALLQEAFQWKENEYATTLKLGRTQLMDALPIMAGQTFGAYAQTISRDRWRLYKVEERLRTINLGGTAVGTGLNADKKYIFLVTDEIQNVTGLGLSRSDYLMDPTQNMDVFVEVSGLLKTAATTLIKIANDIRILSMGPRGGIGEYTIPSVQVGSSIMPGKVNPVLCEMIIQVAYKVIANDGIITNAASSGLLELNAFGPIIIDSLLESMELLKNGIHLFRTQLIDGLIVNKEKCLEHLENSTVLATALVHHLGYDQASEIAKKSLSENKKIRDILFEENLLSIDEINKILDPLQLVKPGIPGR